VIPHQIEPWRWYQRGQFRDEIKRFEDYMGCAVSPPVPELIGYTSVRENRKTFRGYGRPCHIAAQIFKLMPGFRWYTDIRMQAIT
jgi:hypothetical protein